MKTSTGSKELDEFMGGYDNDIITVIYGPGGTAKSNLCLIAAAELAKNNKKVIYLDTEEQFSVDRLKQLLNNQKALDNILVFKINNFKEQQEKINELSKLIHQNKISLVIIDSFSTFYRLELQEKDPKEVNRQIAVQLKTLREINKNYNIPVILTNQVYDDFQTKGVKMVGGQFIQNFSKCVIELQKDFKRKFIIKKHRTLPEEEMYFEITNDGITTITHPQLPTSSNNQD